MKIVGSDNHARETVSDQLWLDGIPDDQKELAQRICDKLNEGLGDFGGTFYQVRSDDYKLYTFESY